MTSPKFEFDHFHHEATRAFEVVQDYLANFNAKGSNHWLSILGKSGVGKTFLARWLASQVPSSKFMRWSTVEDYMRKGDFGIIDHICNHPFIILDDIGAGYDTALTKSKLLYICDRRANKPTIFTSNLLLRQIGKNLDVRIASRMMRDENQVIQMRECPDYCVSKKTKKSN